MTPPHRGPSLGAGYLTGFRALSVEDGVSDSL